jgi:alkylation response protein AidB-like acyl-CoA dehydrogenase
VNDPVKSDLNAKTDDATLEKAWDLGVFALQVPEKYGGLALNNTQYSRLGEIIGEHDLGLAVTFAAHQSIGYKVHIKYFFTEIHH